MSENVPFLHTSLPTADEMHFVPTLNGLTVFYNHATVGTLCRVSAICDVKAFVLLTGNVFVPAWADEIHFVPTVN